MLDTSVYYDESKGQWFIADDLQKKVDELLAIRRQPISLMEVYEFIAESIPDPEAREIFLSRIKTEGAWHVNYGFLPKEKSQLQFQTDDLTVLHFDCDKI